MIRRRLAVVAAVLLASAGVVRAEEDIDTPPCSNNAVLHFDDIPEFRIGDPKRAEKQAAGMNPLQVKEVQLNASETEISMLVRTHDSFDKFWDYAQRRQNARAILPTPSEAAGGVRGELAHFIAVPKGRMGQAIEVRVWLEYTYAQGYTPKVSVTNQSKAALNWAQGAPAWRKGLPVADLSSPINVTLGQNEAEIRIPTRDYGFESDDEILFHFRKGDTSVCIPEMD